MEFITITAQKVVMFLVKFFVTFWLLIIVIILCRGAYCYSVASTSAENLLPQIARIVAEENGCPVDNDYSISGGTSVSRSTFSVINDLVNAQNYPYKTATGDTDFTIQCAAYEYVPYGNDGNFANATNGLSAEDCSHGINNPCSFTVRRVDNNTGTATGKNLAKQNITVSGADGNVVQRGDIIEVQVTVYATIISNIRFGPRDLQGLDIHWPITRTIRVPAVKYYRGL
jgi:hypothetical protein